MKQKENGLPDDIQQTDCGEASIYMVRTYISGDLNDNGITLDTIINTAKNKKWYTPGQGADTSPANMVNIANHFSPDHRCATFRNVDLNDNGLAGLKLLANYLSNKSPVIVDVTEKMGAPRKGNAHFVVVTGLSSSGAYASDIEVNVDNPWTGNNEPYGFDAVWKSWSGNDDPGGKGWWLVMN